MGMEGEGDWTWILGMPSAITPVVRHDMRTSL